MKPVASLLSIRTHQLYEKGKEEMKKKNIRLWSYYYWQLKIFSPKSLKWCFTSVMAMNENKRGKTQHNKSMEEVTHTKKNQPKSATSYLNHASTSAQTPIYFK